MDEPRGDDLEVEAGEPEERGLYDLEDEEAEAQSRQRLNADFLLDKVIPGDIDWRDLVRRHPLLSVGVAATLGFLIGRAKGAAIVAGASAAVTATVMRQLSDVLDGDLLEF
ncbi:MAG: hypothetical protein ACOY3Y_02500 [Acidobacteriota bacterium]